MRKTPNEALERLSKEEFKSAPKYPLMLILDNVRSLNNIGSIFRTADAFLLDGIALCGITAQPPHRDINKTALGATETVDWKYYTSAADAVKELKAAGWQVYAIEQAESAIELSDFQPQLDQRYALILGNEVKGVDAAVMEMVDGAIEVPQFGTKHSLNISVCAGVVTWDIWSKIRALVG